MEKINIKSLILFMAILSVQGKYAQQAPLGSITFHYKKNPFISAVHTQFSPQAGVGDQGFGNQAVIKYPFLTSSAYDVLTGLVVLDDGSIIVSGYTGNSITGRWKLFVMRFAKNGQLDCSFGKNGIIFQQFSDYFYDQINTLVLVEKNYLLVAGETKVDSLSYQFLVARYTLVGSLDTTFGDQGKVIQPFLGDGRYDEVNALALDSNGRSIVVGYSKDNSGQKIAVACYTSTGQLDPSFGNKGTIVQSFLGTQHRDEAIGLIIQKDGNSIVAATCADEGFGKVKVLLLCYSQAGKLQSVWGDSGIIKESFLEAGCKDKVEAIALFSDDSFIIGGSSSYGMGEQGFLIKYTKDGNRDKTFGVGGVVLQPLIAPDATYDCINAITVQPDGKIIVVGETGDGTNFQTFIARYDSTGSLDTTFAAGGILLLEHIGDGNGDEFLRVALAPDSAIIAAGYTQDQGGSKVLVTRRINPLNIACFKAQHSNQSGFY